MARTEVRSEQIKQHTLILEDLKDFAPTDGGGLTLTVLGGRIRLDSTITDKSSQNVALTASTTNYVEIDSLGAASKNTTGFTSGSIPIAQVVTGSSSITTINDKRVWIATNLAGEGARAYHSTSQNVNDTTWTSLALNSERFDDNSYHDNSSNNSRLTVSSDGLYIIWGNVEWDVNDTGLRNLRILLNGSDVIAQVSEDPSGERRYQVSTIAQLSQNDYVELQVYQNSGGTRSISSSGQWSPEFAIAKVQ